MKHKVSELNGALLDAAVAKAEGFEWRWSSDRTEVVDVARRYTFAPSVRWSEGGPIIERERIMLSCFPDGWRGYIKGVCDIPGPTPLIAAMRAYVAHRFGEEVELP